MKETEAHLFAPVVGLFSKKGSQEKISGHLKIKANNGEIILELMGYFEKEYSMFKLNYSEPEALITGELAYHKFAFLSDCLKSDMSSTNLRVSHVLLKPSFIGIGPPPRFNGKYLFTTLALRPQHIDDWANRNGIKVVLRKGSMIPTYKVSKKEWITFYKTRAMHIYLIFRGNYSLMDSHKADASYHAYLNIEFKKKFRREEMMIEWKDRVKRFYDLITGYRSGMEHVEGLGDSGNYQIYYQNNVLYPEYGKLSEDHFILGLKGNEKTIKKMFEAFVEKYENLRVSFDFYFKVSYSQNRDDEVVMNFLSLLSAIEIAFKWVERDFIEKDGKVKIGAKNSLLVEARLKGFVWRKDKEITGLSAVLIVVTHRIIDVVSSFPEAPFEIINEIVLTRNYFVHDGGAKDINYKPLSRNSLRKATQRLRVYIEAYYLHILGLENDKISRATFRSLRNEAQEGHRIMK